MPSWNTITKSDLDAKLSPVNPDTPDYDIARPLIVTELQGSLDVSWPSPFTKRIMEFRLFGDRTLCRRQLPSGVWKPFVSVSEHWYITRVAGAVPEPRLLDARDGSAPLLRLVPENAHQLLLVRHDSSEILALGYSAEGPFYALYS